MLAQHQTQEGRCLYTSVRYLSLPFSFAVLFVDIVGSDGKFILHNISGLLGKRGFLISNEELVPFWSAGKVFQDRAKYVECSTVSPVRTVWL